MRTAVFSDVHGNLEALRAVQRAGEELGVERWVCLGDIVGYGADPTACLELSLELAGTAVRGNHDAAVASLEGVEYFNHHARRAVEWTRQVLPVSAQAILKGLRLTHADGRTLYVHAEPADPGAWNYVTGVTDAAAALQATTAHTLFVGHSHLAFICAIGDAGVQLTTSGRGRHVLAGRRCLVNVGSVGQPRDGDPRASFAVCDPSADTIDLVRVDYDVARAQEKIVDSGLPPFLAYRLERGS